MWDFIVERRGTIAFNTYQHALLVAEAVALATVIGIALAVLVTRRPSLSGVATIVSAIGLTLPSFALIGLLLPVTSIGPTNRPRGGHLLRGPPILRNAVTGLQGVDADLVESARGMGLSEVAVLWRVQLPLAWPVIHAGIRTSTQMSMGVAAIAALVLGPGLGVYIYTGLTQIGGVNAVRYAVVGTVGIVIVALLADLFLLLLGRLTISRGIRA